MNININQIKQINSNKMEEDRYKEDMPKPNRTRQDKTTRLSINQSINQSGDTQGKKERTPAILIPIPLAYDACISIHPSISCNPGSHRIKNRNAMTPARLAGFQTKPYIAHHS